MLHGMAKISIWTDAMKKKSEQNMQLSRENIDVMFSLRRKDIWEMESNVSEIQWVALLYFLKNKQDRLLQMYCIYLVIWIDPSIFYNRNCFRLSSD